MLTKVVFECTGSGVATLSSAIKSKCGRDKSYSNDLSFATLIIP